MSENNNDTSQSQPSAATAATTTAAMTSKRSEHLSKLKDANTKYKGLLKMAKGRIQSQEEDIEKLKAALKQSQENHFAGGSTAGGAVGMGGDGASSSTSISNSQHGFGSHSHSHGLSDIYYSYDYDIVSAVKSNSESTEEGTFSVVRVCQRIKVENDFVNVHGTGELTNSEIPLAGGINDNSTNINGNGNINGNMHTINDLNNNNNNIINNTAESSGIQIQIWALIEYEHSLAETNEGIIYTTPPKRFLRWRKFPSETSICDHIRRNTGEPITLPPYSLSPSQSALMEQESRQAVAHVTEEFRRFRVRSEVARKQSDATVRALQNNKVQTAQRHIEGEDLATELAQARTDHEQLKILKIEMGEQEAQWKEAYDVLLAENHTLKSSGSEALLAAQWRHRYETCLTEKEKAESALQLEREKMGRHAHERTKDDAGKYEAKYKDLKESFRLYRKKAKEIFEAQQKGEVSMLNMTDTNTEDAKLSYLRNLMVNYLSSDPAVREHMEGAIGTVLKFSNEDCAKISNQKTLHKGGHASWF